MATVDPKSSEEHVSNSNLAVNSIITENADGVVVHGDAIDKLTDAEWDQILSRREILFARTSPKHKLEIVTRCQAKGHIVGVSGDGVNDSPALKKADLGISMNKSASDVSKEAATMILLDDDFCSIVHGIEQGRLLFANLKKSIRYTLTHLLPEVAAFLVFIVAQVPLPINTLLLLTIDLATELAPSMSLAWEEPDSELMLIPPRKVLCTNLVTCSQYEALSGNPHLSEQHSAIHQHLGSFPYALSPSLQGRYYNTIACYPPSTTKQRPLGSLFSEPRLGGGAVGNVFGSSSVSDPRNDSVTGVSINLPPFSTMTIPLTATPVSSFKLPSPCIESPRLLHVGAMAPTWQNKLSQWYKRNFTREESGEVLVDADLILWAFIEGGLIVTIGCFLAYLTQFYLSGIPLSILWQSASVYFVRNSPTLVIGNNSIGWESQLKILLSAQSAYFMAIVIGQIFTLFMVKKLYDYPLGRDTLR